MVRVRVLLGSELGLRSPFSWNGTDAAGFCSISADLALYRKCPGVKLYSALVVSAT